MKRQRGRNNNNRRNSGGNNNNPNRSLDSNGPDVKIRGSAATIYEKYTNLARDAKISGSRVKAENYRQHAEHYLRLMQSMQPKVDPNAEVKHAQNDTGAQDAESRDSEKSATSKNKPRQPREPNSRRETLDKNPANDQETAETKHEADGGETAKAEAKPSRRRPAPKAEAQNSETSQGPVSKADDFVEAVSDDGPTQETTQETAQEAPAPRLRRAPARKAPVKASTDPVVETSLDSGE